MSEIEDLRCERLPETADKQVTHKKLLKVIILGDTGKLHFYQLPILRLFCPNFCLISPFLSIPNF